MIFRIINAFRNNGLLEMKFIVLSLNYHVRVSFPFLVIIRARRTKEEGKSRSCRKFKTTLIRASGGRQPHKIVQAEGGVSNEG